MLKKFWDVERAQSPEHTVLTSEEKSVTEHYPKNHYHDESGMFIVPLPKLDDACSIGESRSKAVRRFLSLERSLLSNGQKDQYNDMMIEYFEMGNAERVPQIDLDKQPSKTFYLPMHVVMKDSSTTKLRVVFDASKVFNRYLVE